MVFAKALLIILAFGLAFMVAQYVERRPTIRLEQGVLTGFKIDGDKTRIDVFLGIPYAAAPIDSLRFTPPQHHSGWNGTLDARNYASPCPQIPTLNNQNEDCLYLNIWTPEIYHSRRYTRKAVMIFFEGTEFSKSIGIPISGQALAAEDVIVVTVNYRLNVFGFLCLGIPEARGNSGLLDQYFAILWVKRNIHRFGGDVEKITLFGYSSGAAGTMLHLTSPRTNGLFQRAILASGSPVSPWHIARNPFVVSRKFATMLRCLDEEPKIVLKCMQNKSTYEIMKTYRDYLEIGNVELFLPVIDDFLPETDKYLPHDPVKSLKDGSYVQVPIIAGISKISIDPQSTTWYSLAQQGSTQLQRYIEQIKIDEIIKRYNFDGTNKDQIIELLRWRYITGSRGDADLLLRQLYQLEFEAKIEAPHYAFLSYLESSYIEPIYAYHIDSFGIISNMTDITVTSDLLLLFGPALILNRIGGRQFNAKELTLSAKFRNKIKNFVNFGIPSQKDDDSWRRYMPKEYYVEYFNESELATDVVIIRNRRTSFWNQLLPKIAQTKLPYGNAYPKELLSPDPAASFKHAMYTLVGLVIALLLLLLICIFLLKKSYREKERHLHMVY